MGVLEWEVLEREAVRLGVFWSGGCYIGRGVRVGVLEWDC